MLPYVIATYAWIAFSTTLVCSQLNVPGKRAVLYGAFWFIVYAIIMYENVRDCFHHIKRTWS